MAKRKGRGMGRYIPGSIEENAPLGTLAGNTAVLIPTQVVTERTLVSSIQATYALAGMTAGDNIGPIEVGVAHSDYSLAEVEEFLERSNSWAEADLPAREISSRKIRRIGMFEVPASVGESVSLFDGRITKTKLNWIVNAGQGLNFYAYNAGGQALATTDPNLHINGKANLFPK